MRKVLSECLSLPCQGHQNLRLMGGAELSSRPSVNADGLCRTTSTLAFSVLDIYYVKTTLLKLPLHSHLSHKPHLLAQLCAITSSAPEQLYIINNCI